MKAVRASLPAGLEDTLGGRFGASRSSTDEISAADVEGPFSFYEHPPTGEVRVSHLEHLARLRLKILQQIDRKRGSLSLEEFEQQEGGNILSGIPAIFKESPEDEQLSHFLLRMGFAKNTEFSEWFLRQEETLFFVKLKSAGPAGIRHTLSRTKLASDVKAVNSPPQLATLLLGPGESAGTEYVLPFTKVTPTLIARRQVVLRRGMAYVPENEMYGILAARFRAYLWQCMRLAEREYKNFSLDERMGRILKFVSPVASTGPGGRLGAALMDGSTLNLANFNVVMNRSFPPCMRLPMEWMREKRSHLKNSARNQLYPFVRAGGMTLEDSVNLWKKEFTNDKSVALDKFDKDYLYTIRWTYGKTGRMKPVTPMGCSGIIGMEHPSGDQAHGCPFKVLEAGRLAELIKKWALAAGLGGGVGWIQDVVSKASVTHEYQLACVELFRNFHPGASGDGVGNSPTAYFAESVAYWKKRDEANAGNEARNA